MTEASATAHFIFDKDHNCYSCEGNWSIINLCSLFKDVKASRLPSSKTLTIDGKALSQFDSAGALTLMHCIELLQKKKNHIELTGFTEQQRRLLTFIESKRETLNTKKTSSKTKSAFYALGKESVFKWKQAQGLVELIGHLSATLMSYTSEWRHFQFPSVVANIHSAGLKALPIIAWLSFLIGIVLAYQMGLELETYGANIYIAYLSGMAIFREFGPLITAIIIAGRTSSAFTAQIGSMKINEELDALNTMGLSPIEFLVVPKMLALLIMFPLLIFWSDVFSTFGAMLMSKFMLHIGYSDFTSRLQESVGLKQMMLGLYKAPVFAVLIALVGCFQGFSVQANADSVGKQTTKSVVQALFLIIVADAFFSVMYGWLDL